MSTTELSNTTTELESKVRSYSRSIPASFVSAQGSTVIADDGRRYLDFLSGCSALNYGHNDPDMAEALIAHVRAGGVVHGLDLRTPVRDRFLQTLRETILVPRGFDHVVQFTGPTGTNAVEAALKLARKVTGRTNVIAFTNGFHGVTAGSLAATGNQHHRMAPNVPLPGVSRALFDGYLGADVDTAELLEQLLSDPSSGFDPPAAILLETVQCEGGLNVASAPWLQRVQEIATAHGALLIVDDIQAGCGRTGSFFSFEPAGITPDIICLSKSLSGFGLPLSIVLLRPELDEWAPGEHNGTFRGNNLGFVTATTSFEKFWSDSALSEAVGSKSMTIAGTLETLAATMPGAFVKGRGMLLGVETGDPGRAGAIAKACFDGGLILETAGPTDSVVKLLPPLTIADAELDAGLTILADAVESTA
ncbi:MAG: diaminobutyrate--2-oxoglutarate transaminase [Actinomycetota bacterium]